MGTILTDKLTGAMAWRGADIVADRNWMHSLTDMEIGALDDALCAVRARGLAFPHFTKDDFPLPRLGGLLDDLTSELEDGRGFTLLRGLPVDRYSEEEVKTIYYGMGLHLGVPVSQNLTGDLIGQVMNVGDLKDPQTRVYETNAYLPYHCDPSDVVGLLCLRKARSGGVSSLVSVAALYNRMVEVCPHYLGLFYRPMYYAHLGEELPTLTPLFSYHAGKLSCRYLRQYIELAHDVMGTSLSKVENEAFDFFDAIAADPELRLDMLLEPGDIQFANNYMILHSRTAFDDHEEQSRRRKMLRLWLKMPNARTLAPDFPGRNGIPARMPVA
ncbi:MAG: TauD/TfdA family dioxygenase [Chromatiales bacterium]|jgi:hypothetical protein|nr:TauD/TfdA family dioxygenase [Chromatiales bacterium]